MPVLQSWLSLALWAQAWKYFWLYRLGEFARVSGTSERHVLAQALSELVSSLLHSLHIMLADFLSLWGESDQSLFILLHSLKFVIVIVSHTVSARRSAL